MKVIGLIFVSISLFLVCHAIKCKVYTAAEADEEYEKIKQRAMENWKGLAEKGHPNKTLEERKQLFDENMAKINAHNSGNSSYCQGPNLFSTLTDEEFEGNYLGLAPPANVDEESVGLGAPAPDE